MQTIDYDSKQVYYDLPDFHNDLELLALIKECLQAQKKAGEAYRETQFTPYPDAISAVKGEALEKILAAEEDISDIRTHRITNSIVFHIENLDGSVISDEVLHMRRQIDEVIDKRIRGIFSDPRDLRIDCSGHYWYPPGGYMGWHTNRRKPGWRMYVSYAEEEHRSFFRYRDPDTGEVITCPDETWNFRLFKITPEKPFWHCVFSETDRFSLGYRIESTSG